MSGNEEWRAIAGYEGHYEVSNHGRVRSLTRTLPHPVSGTRTYFGKILSPCVMPKGHLQVGLNWYGKRKMYMLHRLVAKAFLGDRTDEGLIVCHNDGDPTNNHISNLRWDSYSSNNFDMVRHGTHWNTAKAQCENGHDLAEPNLVPSDWKNGRRKCLACARARGWVINHPDHDLAYIADLCYKFNTTPLKAIERS